MNINELRINNYYKINKSVSIDENVFKLDLIDIRANKNICDLIDPIPLTEEWLLKFGFDDLGDYGFGIGEFHIRMHSNELYFPISNRKIYIINVHQLQNLYFALKGKELASIKAN